MGKEKPVEGKFVTSVKVGPKGQIIVPKEVPMSNRVLLSKHSIPRMKCLKICFRERNNLWRIYCRASFRGAVFFCRKSKTCKTCIDFHRLTRYNANMVLQVKLITL